MEILCFNNIRQNKTKDKTIDIDNDYLKTESLTRFQ